MSTRICNPEKAPWTYHRRYAVPSHRFKIASAKRCLFGSLDFAANQTWLKKVQGDVHAANNSKWNFDFSSGRPLAGNFAWESTGRSTGGGPLRAVKRKNSASMPPCENSAFYFQPIEPAREPPQQQQGVVGGADRQPVDKGAAVQVRKQGAKKQPKITEFMTVTKSLPVVTKESFERSSKIPKLGDCSS